MNKYLIILLILPAWASAQTLYVPNGTSGIGTSPNGSVGIGTSTPDAGYKLDIHGGGIHVANTATNGYTFLGRDNNYSYFYHRMTGSFHMMGSNRNSSGTLRGLGFAVGGENNENDIKMSIAPDGNVGIGVTYPNQRLEVNGGILQASENTAFGVDAIANARLGIIKKQGFHPMIASDNVSPLLFGQTNQSGVHTNIAGATLTERMRIEANGYVKIGGGTPRGKFDVDGPGDIYLTDDPNTGTNQSVFLPGHIYISPYNGQNVCYLQARRLDNSGSTSLIIRTYNNGNITEAMNIQSDGDVGIGTVSPDAKLTVKGDIHTREVRVDMDGATGPDYVFEKDYNLLPLSELEAYIHENKHLPEVPSAEEMETNGLNLKEMNLILLKKVEELTLHLIEANKKIESLDREVRSRKKRRTR